MDRTIYLIAHRVNAVDDIALALERGANAIECDVRHGVVDHDGAFPWSTRLDRWLDRAAEIAEKNADLALIYFDVKEPSALPDLIDQAERRLPATLAKLFSIARYEDRAAFRDVASKLAPASGLAIDEHDDPAAVATFFREIGVGRCWYGNGVFVAGPPWLLPGIAQSIRRAVTLRAADGYPAKVAVWTLAKEQSMRDFLRLGVDGVMVNTEHLGRLTAAVDGTLGIRRARRGDSAF